MLNGNLQLTLEEFERLVDDIPINEWREIPSESSVIGGYSFTEEGLKIEFVNQYHSIIRHSVCYANAMTTVKTRMGDFQIGIFGSSGLWVQEIFEDIKGKHERDRDYELLATRKNDD